MRGRRGLGAGQSVSNLGRSHECVLQRSGNRCILALPRMSVHFVVRNTGVGNGSGTISIHAPSNTRLGGSNRFLLFSRKEYRDDRPGMNVMPSYHTTFLGPLLILQFFIP